MTFLISKQTRGWKNWHEERRESEKRERDSSDFNTGLNCFACPESQL